MIVTERFGLVGKIERGELQLVRIRFKLLEEYAHNERVREAREQDGLVANRVTIHGIETRFVKALDTIGRLVETYEQIVVTIWRRRGRLHFAIVESRYVEDNARAYWCTYFKVKVIVAQIEIVVVLARDLTRTIG